MDFLSDEIENANDRFTAFEDCVVGNTFDGGRIFSLKKMVKKTVCEGFDEMDAEEFILRNMKLIKYPGDLVLYDLH